MIGTTRPRVSFFMNKFRNLGFIEYNGKMKCPQFIVERRPARIGRTENLRTWPILNIRRPSR